ncbi:hypothetical protein [Symbiopectobacterium purcellii]|uniref:hypothetical protein n=1 Tax=Symbiopectobacterium purcellii TaxID=2871826 RepID=UPI003F85AEC2
MITFKDFMRSRGLSNAEVADAFMVSPQMVSQWKHDARLFVDEKEWKIIRISIVKDKINEALKIK